jgi:phage gpG-like protein
MPNPFQARFTSIEHKLQQTLAALPAKAGAVVVHHSLESFHDQGWTDSSLEPWSPRLSKNGKNTGRAILVQSGRLRRSIRVLTATADSVTVGTDVPYAQIHNEGGTISHPARDTILNFTEHKGIDYEIHGKKSMRLAKVQTINQQRGIKAIRRATIKEHTTTMKKRQFIGNSKQQTEEITFMLQKEINKAFSIK